MMRDTNPRHDPRGHKGAGFKPKRPKGCPEKEIVSSRYPWGLIKINFHSFGDKQTTKPPPFFVSSFCYSYPTRAIVLVVYGRTPSLEQQQKHNSPNIRLYNQPSHSNLSAAWAGKRGGKPTRCGCEFRPSSPSSEDGHD